MSKYTYRLLSLRLVSKIVPEDLDSVLIGIPGDNLDLARALPDHQNLDEDDLFRSLLTRNDYRIIHELLETPSDPDSVEYFFSSFRDTKNLPAPHRTSKDGKKFWRIATETSFNQGREPLTDLQAEPLPPMAPA
jgi:hypothetical protein